VRTAGRSSRRADDGAPQHPGSPCATSLRTAPLDNARRVVWRILSGKEYTPPEPFQNLKLHLEVAQLTYNKVQNQGVDESRLNALRTYMDADRRRART
jgi:hypothetical protein